ncbi:unnamed protein product [Clavelina lepadiformis]|uniref:NAD-dependent protein deacylase n=1 Tax=Clavelina lepadiformis TaxID=159417 RepID=A0ABP0EX68_CLALP
MKKENLQMLLKITARISTYILQRRKRRYERLYFNNMAKQVGIHKELSRPSSDMAALRNEVKKARHILILSGAGISAESGVPTFRGAGGYWRQYQAQDLATPDAFAKNPSLVWEFYHHRREVMNSKTPNPAHFAIAEYEKRLENVGGKVVVVTQNIDELHKVAGTNNLFELHGSLFKTKCTSCGEIKENRDSPICEALRNKGAPDAGNPDARIPIKDLPKCTSCEVESCDMCFVIGTSSVVYPAAMFAPQVALRGVTVAEFNLEDTPGTRHFKYHFCGPAGVFVPQALAEDDSN